MHTILLLVMSLSGIRDDARIYSKKLRNTKSLLEFDNWYKYDILANFEHLTSVLRKFPLHSLTGKSSNVTIADIGAADGDLSFFLHSEYANHNMDLYSDIIDYGPTNYNHLEGANLLVKHFHLQNNIRVFDMNIDRIGWILPRAQYNIIFLLGILYHLKNPYYVLENLAKYSEYVILSTRVMQYTPDRIYVGNNSLAYLVDNYEQNGDNTNFWTFTTVGLERLVMRTGWEILARQNVGDMMDSNPNDLNHDERCFMLLKSSIFKSM